MNIEPDVIKQNHGEWMSQGMTSLVVKAIKKHRESFVALLAANATNGNKTDAEIRYMAVNVKNTDAILALIEDPELLVTVLNK